MEALGRYVSDRLKVALNEIEQKCNKFGYDNCSDWYYLTSDSAAIVACSVGSFMNEKIEKDLMVVNRYLIIGSLTFIIGRLLPMSAPIDSWKDLDSTSFQRRVLLISHC